MAEGCLWGDRILICGKIRETLEILLLPEAPSLLEGVLLMNRKPARVGTIGLFVLAAAFAAPSAPVQSGPKAAEIRTHLRVRLRHHQRHQSEHVSL